MGSISNLGTLEAEMAYPCTSHTLYRLYASIGCIYAIKHSHTQIVYKFHLMKLQSCKAKLQGNTNKKQTHEEQKNTASVSGLSNQAKLQGRKHLKPTSCKLALVISNVFVMKYLACYIGEQHVIMLYIHNAHCICTHDLTNTIQ